MLGAGSDDGGMEAQSLVEEESGFSAEREARGGMSRDRRGCLSARKLRQHSGSRLRPSTVNACGIHCCSQADPSHPAFPSAETLLAHRREAFLRNWTPHCAHT